MDSLLECRFNELLAISVNEKLSSKKNVVFGNPDFYCFRRKLAFFIDGDIFHNKRLILAKKIRTASFKKRLLAGVRRDSLVNKTLKHDGWTVMRISESEIKNHPDFCINLIKKAFKQHENQN
jgi:very-short-patch-repair endonuclease